MKNFKVTRMQAWYAIGDLASLAGNGAPTWLVFGVYGFSALQYCHNTAAKYMSDEYRTIIMES